MYAISVPIDIMSTRLLRSNIIAINEEPVSIFLFLVSTNLILPRTPVIIPLMMVAMKGVWNLGWM